jgi:undecaprenyl-diphosphatase
MGNPIQRLGRWLGGQDLLLLLTLLAADLAIWAFLLVANAVNHGRTQSLDEQILRLLRRPDDPAVPIGPGWLGEMGRDFTALGGVAVLGLVTAAVAGYLCIRRQFHAMWLVLGATLSGQVLSGVLKALFDRPRPAVVPHLSHTATSSFPSGHSMMAAVVYLTLGALLARLAPHRRLKLYFLSLAVLLTILVGLSRVYMGVHYPTDVAAGWCVGLAWAILCWWLARWLQRSGAIESSGAAENEQSD